MKFKTFPVFLALLFTLAFQLFSQEQLMIYPKFPAQEESVELTLKFPEAGRIAGREFEAEVKFTTRNGKSIVSKEQFKPAAQGNVFTATWSSSVNGIGRLEVKPPASVYASPLTFERELVVLGKKLYFPWWIGNQEMYGLVNNATSVLSKDEFGEYWRGRGILPCRWKGATVYDAEKYVAYLQDKLPKDFGIMIDELGYYELTPQKAEIIKGIKQLNSLKPDIPIHLYICGALKPDQCLTLKQRSTSKTGCDLLMLEAYHDYQVAGFNAYKQNEFFNQRIKMARDYDVLQYCVMILSVCDVKGYNVTPALLEQQFRHIRSTAPEMPGVGFYSAKTEVLTKAADLLTWKYYIEPVLTSWDKDIIVNDSALRVGSANTVTAKVYNIGGVDSDALKVKLLVVDKNKGKTVKLAERLVQEIPCNVGTPSGVCAIDFDWKPKKSGYYELIVELYPLVSSNTVLNGRVSKTVFVQKK